MRERTYECIARRVGVMVLQALFVVTVAAQTDYDMRYTVAFDTLGHYLNVQLDYQQNSQVNELVLNMPRWTPGYYEMLKFPKHLCDFVAEDVQ